MDKAYETEQSKYRQMRREWQAESDIKQAYHITLDVAVHDEQLTEKCWKNA